MSDLNKEYLKKYRKDIEIIQDAIHETLKQTSTYNGKELLLDFLRKTRNEHEKTDREISAIVIKEGWQNHS